MMSARILAHSAIFLIASAICGQEPPVRGILLDETKPSVYIQYVTFASGAGKIGEKLKLFNNTTDASETFNADKLVSLQLFNNTTSAISSRVQRKPPPVIPCYSIVEIPVLDRSVENSAFGAGLRINWKFEFWSYKRLADVWSSCYGDAGIADRILPGESVFFTVPRNYLTSNYILAVNFNYKWGAGYRGTGTVVFSEGDPEKIFGEPAAPNLAEATFTQEMLLDATQPAVDFEYVKPRRIMEKGNHEETGVMFRLFNNTRKAIRIPTESLDRIPVNSRPLTRYLILDDGRNVSAARSGNRIYPCYEAGEPPVIPDWIGSVEEFKFVPDRDFSPPFSPDCSVRSVSWVASGENVFFIVPYDHLNPDYALYIPFNYEWEKETSNVIHSRMYSLRRIWRNITKER